MMRYRELTQIAAEKAVAAFGEGNTHAICDALTRITIYHGDRQWVQGKCISFARHPNAEIRGVAVTCLGHLARLYGVLDTKEVVPLLGRLLKDPEVSGRAADALSDIETFAMLK